MKLTLFAVLALALAPVGFSQSPCTDSVTAAEFSSCLTEVSKHNDGKIDSLSLKLENRKAYPLRCELQVDSFQAKDNPIGIDDCINDQTSSSRIKQKNRLIFQVAKSAIYESTFSTGVAAQDPSYHYCQGSIGTNVSCSRGCEDGKVEKNGECVAGDCYDSTQDVLLAEGGSTTKTVSTPIGDNRCSMTNITFSCQSKVMNSKIANSDTGVMLNGQCTAGCFDVNQAYHTTGVEFPENFNNFQPDQTCTVVSQTSICRAGYSAPTRNSSNTPGFTYGTECRTACIEGGRRLALGEKIEGRWSNPRPPVCEKVKIDRVCEGRYEMVSKRQVIRPSTPSVSCGNS